MRLSTTTASPCTTTGRGAPPQSRRSTLETLSSACHRVRRQPGRIAMRRYIACTPTDGRPALPSPFPVTFPIAVSMHHWLLNTATLTPQPCSAALRCGCSQPPRHHAPPSDVSPPPHPCVRPCPPQRQLMADTVSSACHRVCRQPGRIAMRRYIGWRRPSTAPQPPTFNLQPPTTKDGRHCCRPSVRFCVM